MLQFNTTICTVTARFTPRLWPLTSFFTTNSPVKESSNINVKHKYEPPSTMMMTKDQQTKFNKLKETVCNSLKKDNWITSRVQGAQNVHDLLALINMPHLPQKDVVMVMNTIINWVNAEKLNMTDTKNENTTKDHKTQNEIVQPTTKTIRVKISNDFSKYSDLSTSAMIKEISNLANMKERNPKLLKFLFDNIVEYNVMLSHGQCSSLLYNIATLCYYDDVLLSKISSDLIKSMNEKSIDSMHSIVKSMAMIRYKNMDFLNHMSKIIIDSNATLENNYVLTMLQAFAILGYDTEQTNTIIERYVPLLSIESLKPTKQLDVVWSLVLLNKATNSQIEPVLNGDFIKSLMPTDSTRNLSKQIKLLNINAAAKYIMKNYQGPLLTDLDVPYVTQSYTKQKQLHVNALEETLKFILKPPDYEMNVNTKMGFILDAVYYRNTNQKPSVVNTNSNKVAIIIHDYYAYCQGNRDLQGIIKLYNKLLEHSGYHLISISYEHFGAEDKLVKRVQLLDRHLKSLK
ncbi:FAST kinase domain-containing protein 4 isoform X1 [Hylaeus anthracinus]|uniref:FAST kinase domain-containing protein 4 isoform X1 n=2 Tax=Hylaeus anthracinus TaxID=313031 RepID=UPI0023B8C4B5|nr:FAST kinase domain-containing protein 4 isoform X1 [Hylaeus anthracinus]XP_054002522.1 FAST kinase domain-containing protein 4 isoform X1 [Hylaeus anthracinus]